MDDINNIILYMVQLNHISISIVISLIIIYRRIIICNLYIERVIILIIAAIYKRTIGFNAVANAIELSEIVLKSLCQVKNIFSGKQDIKRF